MLEFHIFKKKKNFEISHFKKKKKKKKKKKNMKIKNLKKKKHAGISNFKKKKSFFLRWKQRSKRIICVYEIELITKHLGQAGLYKKTLYKQTLFFSCSSSKL